ncbi:hypothetical protein HYW75_02450 [Candidatus Pacearchaeota archaeon]|nr:hypothetical protein [Candidatus Pacearchaeota archaeon]
MNLLKKTIILSLGIGSLLLNEGCIIRNRDYTDIRNAYVEFSDGYKKYKGEKMNRMTNSFYLDLKRENIAVSER